MPCSRPRSSTTATPRPTTSSCTCRTRRAGAAVIVPSIDLQGGRTVQLVGGEEKAIDAGDPRPIAERFALAGEIAVIDLDAAMRKGRNAALIEGLLAALACRVGGGIRDVETAIRWLDRGARRSSSARPPARDPAPSCRASGSSPRSTPATARSWSRAGSRAPAGASWSGSPSCKAHVGGLPRHLRRARGPHGRHRSRAGQGDGRGRGKDAASPSPAASPPPRRSAPSTRSAPTPRSAWRSTPAGSTSPTRSWRPCRPTGPTGSGPRSSSTSAAWRSGLVYSSRESIREAVGGGWASTSRARRGLWVKGETSGATQELLRIDLDCDRDGPRFVVRQHGPGFCHLDTRTCWGEDAGLGHLARAAGPARRNRRRPAATPPGCSPIPTCWPPSCARRRASWPRPRTASTSIWEAADVLYFTLARLAREGIDLAEVEAHLDRRSLKVTRRG